MDQLFNTFCPTALEGKGAVITGAASGMGRATAIGCAGTGADVVLVDKNGVGLEETAAMIEIQTGRAPAALVEIDLGTGDPGEAVIGRAAEALPRLTTLVNCAGIGRGGPGPELESKEYWDTVLRTNLDSTYLLSRAAIPHMREAGGGSIVNISSIAARRNFRARGDRFAYPAAKAGVIGLTQSMSYVLGRDRIRVNVILPGLVRTGLAAEEAGLAERAQEISATGEGIPIMRIGEPVDIAACALFLASDASGYITGAEFVIDGGLTVEVGMDRFF